MAQFDADPTIPDLDPANPEAGHPAVLESVPDTAAIQAANLGLDGRGDVATDEGPEPNLGTPATLTVDVAQMDAFLKACMSSAPRVGYKLGAKIKAGQVPGRDFVAVDCSGFVREIVRRCTVLGSRFPDGSVVQHDWVKAKGFKLVQDVQPGTVYLAFLSPSDTRSGIGHVVFIHDGRTIESHGGTGPDTRPWTRTGWQSKARVYVIDPAGP